MTSLQTRQRPGRTGRSQSNYISCAADITTIPNGAELRALYGNKQQEAQDRPQRLPANWRDRLPHPSVYYRAHIPGLGKPGLLGWAVGPCPFHSDTNNSLSVHLAEPRGGFRCSQWCWRRPRGFRDASA
jgi:hypothetical protein